MKEGGKHRNNGRNGNGRIKIDTERTRNTEPQEKKVKDNGNEGKRNCLSTRLEEDGEKFGEK